MQTVNKGRTPSRCREWEKQRRNKFNEAINRLGELVKGADPAKSNDKSSDNAHYPKIEIIHKAISCLKQLFQERTQLKAEILALQVKLDTHSNNKTDFKDVSTQVYLGINRKKINVKVTNILPTNDNDQAKVNDKKCINVCDQTKTVTTTNNLPKHSTKEDPVQILPKILPKSLDPNANKNIEKTIMVLPATPYLFPQRPVLLPGAPPTIFFVDSNMKSTSKPPTTSKKTNDVTKTTMVNILPISAYSCPLSATKVKRHRNKLKNDVKKSNRKAINVAKSNSINDNNVNNETDSGNESTKIKISETTAIEENKDLSDAEQNNSNLEIINSEKSHINIENRTIKIINKEDELTSNSQVFNEKVNTSLPVKSTSSTMIIPKTTLSEIEISKNFDSSVQQPAAIEIQDSNNKKKDTKLANILDSTICEGAVEGGNARLELAEEFLATSPTAAFLMSFPVVTGGRADSPTQEAHNTVVVSKVHDPKINDDEQQSTLTSVTRNDTKLLDKCQYSKNDQGKLSGSTSSEKHLKKDNKILNENTSAPNTSTENPFLTLSNASHTPCTLIDSSFITEFDSNNKNAQASHFENNNIFYKSDNFDPAKSTIYSTSSINAGPDYNSFSFYPCAIDKYSSKSKTNHSDLKIDSSRLTYDIDLGWSHKSLDFVSCTTANNNYNKDNLLSSTPATYSAPYNPFNPEFHMSLVSSSSKSIEKSATTTLVNTVTSLHPQGTNLWAEDINYYINNNTSEKILQNKNLNYPPIDHNVCDLKSTATYSKANDLNIMNKVPVTNSGNITEKYNKKTQNKMHINWMTSETRPTQISYCRSSCTETKDPVRPYEDIRVKKQQDLSSYFPIPINNYATHQEEFHMWPSSRPQDTTEISIDPPPINLPTLVGDLALGPSDRKKNAENSNRSLVAASADLQQSSSFFSVTHLMNNSNEFSSRPSVPIIHNSEAVKHSAKHSTENVNAVSKIVASNQDRNLQPCYINNEPKVYEQVGPYPQPKTKNSRSEKNSKLHKNSYSAESLLRGGTCAQKNHDNVCKKPNMLQQKTNEFNANQETSLSATTHFPQILDYCDNSFPVQQFSGSGLYSSTASTVSNNFYSNFMSGTNNFMPGNYSSGTFSGDYIDYNQIPECNYSNYKYNDLKFRNNTITAPHDRIILNSKNSRRELAKHKPDFAKKEQKKFQNKRAKLNDMEEWQEGQSLWQNKLEYKRQPNVSEELQIPSHMNNQMPTQYQTELFNCHLMPSNNATMSHGMDRTLNHFSVNSRTNFNLSTIFPEITMKVQ